MGQGGARTRGRTRRVDDLVTALGIDSGVSKSQVSHICTELDGAVGLTRFAGQSDYAA